MNTKEFYEYIKTLDLGYYEIGKNGVWIKVPTEYDDDGIAVKFKTTRVCSIPIAPTALYENVDSGCEKIEISYLKKNRWRSIIVDREKVASNQQIIKLANDGIEVSSDNSKQLVSYFSNFVSNNLSKIPYKLSRGSLGWYGDDFVPYTGDITFDGAEEFRAIIRAIRPSGSLEEWEKHVTQLRKNKQMRLMIDVSFASPLIEKAGENPFMFHCWGTTSFGKTVALMTAMSIWGDPSMGALTKTLNMTPNAMLAQAGCLYNLPFAGDELQTIKNKCDSFDTLIMTLTEGIDRQRLNQNSSLKDTKSWRCAFITTGEETCVKQGSGGGTKNRVIEMECKNKLVENGNFTAEFVKNNYGTAGREYIELLKDINIKEMYRKKFNEILSTVETSDKQAGAAALILVADELVYDHFFAEEEPLTVEDISPYLRSIDDISAPERAYSYVCDVISENAVRFDADNNGSVWGVLDGDEVYINKTVLRRILNEQSFDLDACRREWIRNGYLKRNMGNNLRWWKTIKGVKTDCYRLLLSKEDEQIEFEDLPF